ncbi:hypothetical protein D3C75_1119590 [compost metagenome]
MGAGRHGRNAPLEIGNGPGLGYEAVVIENHPELPGFEADLLSGFGVGVICEHHGLQHFQRFYTVLVVPCEFGHVIIEGAAAIGPGIGGEDDPGFPIPEEVSSVGSS